jgi:hypothetical protein
MQTWEYMIQGCKFAATFVNYRLIPATGAFSSSAADAAV